MKTKLFLSTIISFLLIIPSVKSQVENPGEDKTGSPYFYIPSDDPENEHLPLKSTSADVNIAGVIADVVVTQIYKNEGKKPIEAVYIFPASTRAEYRDRRAVCRGFQRFFGNFCKCKQGEYQVRHDIYRQRAGQWWNGVAATADKFGKYISSPVLTDVNVAFTGFEAYDLAQQTYPDIFADKPVMIFGKYHGYAKGNIAITGRNGEGDVRQQVDLALLSPDKSNSALGYLWAREMIRQLDDLANNGYSMQEVEDQVTKLGLDYNLLTNYTSFVAIDSEARNKDGNATTVRQPLPLPEGVSNLAVGGCRAKSCAEASQTVLYDMASEMPDFQEYKEEQSVEPYLVVEQMPEFPGGEDSLLSYLKKNIRYPESSRESSITGIVYVRFILGKDGSISNVTLLRGIGGGCDEEAMRVIKAMPKWIPGKQNGKAVPVYLTLLVKFKL
jgi:TonB family protein